MTRSRSKERLGPTSESRFVQVDIADRDAVFALCDHDDISVFHLASVLSGGGEADFDLALHVNLEGGRNVLETEAALRVITSLAHYPELHKVNPDVAASVRKGLAEQRLTVPRLGVTGSISRRLMGRTRSLS